MTQRKWLIPALVLALLLVPASGWAQDTLPVTVTTSAACGDVTFEVSVEGGTAPFILSWSFGDSETLVEPDVQEFPHLTEHTYPAQGSYFWTLDVEDSEGMVGLAEGSVMVDSLEVLLNSDPFPPLVYLESGEATVNFTADVSGDNPPFTFEWDLDGDGTPDPGSDPTSNTASFTYTEAGKYQATVTVEDACGFTESDTLTVLVIDPEAEACHPMAQRIADAVNKLFPDRAEQLYTCQDILDIFRGGLTGSQVGFGRMWHAYKLTQIIEDLTWEEIRDWHLDGNGWGLLLQLNRFAAALEDLDLGDLFERVMAGDATVQNIRQAVQVVMRYEADFEEALEMLAGGASPGEVKKFYRTAEDLELDPEVLNGYLEMGLSLTELRHAAKIAERFGADWAEIAAAHAVGYSWGELNQAQRLADGEVDVETILEMGVKEFRRQQREQQRAERQDRTAGRLAEQYGVSAEEAWGLFDSVCDGDWKCVREQLREQARGQERGGGKPAGNQDKDARTAARIAAQYGVSEDAVWGVYQGDCGGDWGCVRAHFRAQDGEPEGEPPDQGRGQGKGKGKGKGKNK